MQAMTWLLDLDGVVWLAGRPIPGSAEAVARLRSAGERVAFLTNNSGPTLAEHVAKLERAGVPATADEVVSSAGAAAGLLEAGQRAYVVGGQGVHEALTAAGVVVVEDWKQADAVVVGRTTAFDFRMLTEASDAVRAGARFIATNTDTTFPTPDGLEPGAGALVAAVAAAAGSDPVVAGKPHQPTVEVARRRFGPIDVVVGDRADTDLALAVAIGCRGVLVLTGVTAAADLPVEPAPDEVADDLAAAVDRFLAGG